ncbi:hypothetical protein SDC9_211136 [bioreactor metagenome]|uniref:Uncharacterized protein n=1 Tax=bioreactor metagenome TaxID=1076179 RepID=A0A645JI53_9ZZZZ
MVEEGHKAGVETFDIQQAQRLLVDTQLRPGPDLE